MNIQRVGRYSYTPLLRCFRRELIVWWMWPVPRLTFGKSFPTRD